MGSRIEFEKHRQPARPCRFRPADQRLHPALQGGHQDRRRPGSVRHLEARFGEAQQEIRAREGAATQLAGVARIHAHQHSVLLERRNGRLQVRKREAGLAADVDDVGALPAQLTSAGVQGFDRQFRRVHDLGEDAHVGARQIWRHGAAAEKARQVHDLVRPAREGHAECRRQPRRVHAGPSRHDHPARRQRPGQPAQDDLLGHQRGHLHADVDHLPVEAGFAHVLQQSPEPLLRQMPGEEDEPLSHATPARAASPPPRREARQV